MEDVSRVQAVIFDVDGTLYNQGSLRRKIAVRMLAAYSVKPAQGVRAARAIQAYRRAHEALRDRAFSAEAQLTLAARESGYAVPEIHTLVERWMEQAPLKLLARCAYPGVTELLETLAKLRIKCGVFSDYPAEKKLWAMGLRRFFDEVLCAQEVGWLKPNPTGLLEVAGRMGVAPSRALYLGDRDIDCQAATQAGMEAIQVEDATTYFDLRHRFSAYKPPGSF